LTLAIVPATITEFPYRTPMATVYKTEFGITAFNGEDKLVMLDSRPMVNWGFSLEKLEDSLTTLEEVMSIVPPCHRYSLETLYFSLKAAHHKLQQEHTEMTEEPTATDFQEYLAAYAAATNTTNQEDFE
jgi:hypothetical protein